jgi:hypothetical protein
LIVKAEMAGLATMASEVGMHVIATVTLIPELKGAELE